MAVEIAGSPGIGKSRIRETLQGLGIPLHDLSRDSDLLRELRIILGLLFNLRLTGQIIVYFRLFFY
jgi:hypothetical protein